MKRIIILSLLLLTIEGVSANAQQNRYYKSSYAGSVELGAKVGGKKDLSSQAITFNTIHGCALGNGIYAGLGVGMEIYSTDLVTIPIFLDAKYSFINNNISPFAEARVGFSPFVNMPYSGDGHSIFLSPAIGLDAKWFSVRVAYQFDGMKECLEENNYEDIAYGCHYVVLSLSYNF